MINKLTQLGLNSYEAKAYLALLKYGVQQGKEVAKHSDVPPTRVFDALHSLVTRRFAAKVQDKPLLFKAIAPEIAINSLVKEQQDSLRILKEELVSSLKETKTNIEQPKITEKISILPGYEALWSFVETNLKTAKKSLKLMFTYEQRPKLNYLMRQAIKRGVKLKIIATKHLEAGLPLMKEHIKLGAQVKYYPIEELRITIKDSEEALITMLNPREKHDRVNIIIESKELSQALNHYFNVIWKKAKVIN